MKTITPDYSHESIEEFGQLHNTAIKHDLETVEAAAWAEDQLKPKRRVESTGSLFDSAPAPAEGAK